MIFRRPPSSTPKDFATPRLAGGAVALTAVLILPLTGCSSGGDSTQSATPPTSTRPASAQTPSLEDLAGSIDRQLAAAKSVKMAIEQDGAVMTVTLDTRSGAPETELHMPADEHGEAMQVLNLREGLYIHDDSYGKPWTKFPPKSENPMARIYTLLLPLVEGMITMAQQKELVIAGGTVTATAAEKVGTVDTTHYTVRVDVPKALERIDRRKFVHDQWAIVHDIIAPDGQPPKRPDTVPAAQADTLARKFGEAMKGQPATVEFWLDAQGVPHKYALVLPSRADTKVGITFTEWGTSKITPPPADQVALAPDDLLGTPG